MSPRASSDDAPETAADSAASGDEELPTTDFEKAQAEEVAAAEKAEAEGETES